MTERTIQNSESRNQNAKLRAVEAGETKEDVCGI